MSVHRFGLCTRLQRARADEQHGPRHFCRPSPSLRPFPFPTPSPRVPSIHGRSSPTIQDPTPDPVAGAGSSGYFDRPPSAAPPSPSPPSPSSLAVLPALAPPLAVFVDSPISSSPTTDAPWAAPPVARRNTESSVASFGFVPLAPAKQTASGTAALAPPRTGLQKVPSGSSSDGRRSFSLPQPTITAEPEPLDGSLTDQGRRAKTESEPVNGSASGALAPVANGRRPSTEAGLERQRSFLQSSTSQQASSSGGLVQRKRLGSKSSNAGGANDARLPQRAGGAAVPPAEEPKVLVGNLIGEDHVNYVLMYNMLTGIRIAVSRTQAKISRPLSAEDFKAKHKYSFDIVGNELTPSARYDFKFKDYAPWVFRDLRENYFRLDPADYLLSLTAKYILSELGSPGKSGSFFYFSRDYRYIIKTISHTEHRFLRSILKDYHAHVVANPHTLLSRFYGLHRVKLPRGPKIHFVIMNNLFPPHRDIHETYDLKGSSVGREYPEDKARLKKGAVMKDINWVRRSRELRLGPEKRALLTEQLRRDTDFLQRMNILDYSLLIGIHNMQRGNKDLVRQNTLQVFDPSHPTGPGTMRRRSSALQHAADARALRKAVKQSDPQAMDGFGHVTLDAQTLADRKHVIFYRDEGGLQATNDRNIPMDVIYYLGVIDICTPFSLVKRLEHFWKGLKQDKHAISAVPPPEYGERFLNFLLSVMPGADQKLRPKGLRPDEIAPMGPEDETTTHEHVGSAPDPKARYKGE